MPPTPDPAAPPALGADADPSPAPEPRVTLITKPGCHLCDVARDVIVAVTAELGVDWVEVDILERPDLLVRYAEQIPVTLVDGRQHDYWRVDADRLRTALR